MTLDIFFQMVVSAIWAVAIFAGVANLAGLCTWVERKLSSMIQDRIGPNRANVRLFGTNITAIGLLHPIADAVKMFMKEDFVPAGANRVLHTLAPMICLFIPFVVFCVLPFVGPLHIQWKDIPSDSIWLIGSLFPGDALHLSDYTLYFMVANLDMGMLFVFGIASLGVYGVLLAGYSSNNKFSFLGALRAANQMIGYEVALGLTAVGVFMIYGSLSLNTIVEQQGRLLWGIIPLWGIFTQFPAFLLFLACGMAEIKKIPFDLPEGESEIIAGYFLEYSSLKFTMFLFAEYVEMILLSAMLTVLFFGGWQIPWIDGEGYRFWQWSGSWAGTWLAQTLGLNVLRILIALLQAAKFTVFLCVWVYMLFMIRWTYPRVRYDQLMKMGWKMILPLALLNIMATGAALAVLRGWI
jgi:NADH-quinone oxidoreductase subunit H